MDNVTNEFANVVEVNPGVDNGIEKAPAGNKSILEMDVQDIAKAGLKAGFFTGVAYLGTRALVGVVEGVFKGARTLGNGVANAASNVVNQNQINGNGGAQ